MQFYHICKSGKVSTLVGEMSQKIQVLSFSTDGGKLVPHLSNITGVGSFSLDDLVCRNCGEHVAVKDALSEDVITGNNHPVTELYIGNGFVYHPKSIYGANDMLKSLIGGRAIPLIKYLGL